MKTLFQPPSAHRQQDNVALLIRRVLEMKTAESASGLKEAIREELEAFQRRELEFRAAERKRRSDLLCSKGLTFGQPKANLPKLLPVEPA